MKRFSRFTLIIICCVMLLALSGCRYSEVLAQLLYDRSHDGDINIHAPFELSENKQGNEDKSDTLKDIEKDDEAQRKTENQEPDILPEPTDAPEPSSAPETVYEESAKDDNSSANTPDYTQADNLGTPGGDPSGQGNGEQGGKGDEPEENGGGEGGIGEQGEGYAPSASATSYKQVVDAYGNSVQIPENVDTVATVDDLAIMTLILSDSSRLAATNAELLSGSASRIFNDLHPEALWPGDGSYYLSSDNFERLLELSPDIVIETSGNATVTNAQVEILKEYEIAYIVIPAMTSHDNIKKAMTTLGEVLGDKSGEGGSNAPKIAGEYCAWADRLKSAVSSATSGFLGETDDKGVSTGNTFTLFVDAWDEDARYRLYNEQYTTRSGKGFALVKNAAHDSCKAISSFLAYANITNTSSGYGISKNVQYFSPLISSYHTIEVLGPLGSGLYANGLKLLEAATDASLGTALFPYVIVPDEEVKRGIQSSDFWDVYPHIDSGDGSFNSDGFLDEEGRLVRSQISGEYEILINPRGLTSWADGGCESILESAWAAWKFFDAISENELRGYISDFYSSFYHYELSDSEISGILEGDFK